MKIVFLKTNFFLHLWECAWVSEYVANFYEIYWLNENKHKISLIYFCVLESDLGKNYRFDYVQFKMCAKKDNIGIHKFI